MLPRLSPKRPPVPEISQGLFLALDQGGHASRALLFDARGKLLLQAVAPIATARHPDGRIEHDAEEIVSSFLSAIGELAAQFSVTKDSRPIRAAGFATQRSSIVCWHRTTGAALSPVISWQDRRNAAFVETLQPHAARIHALTGLVLSPHYGASKLRWCLEHLAQVQAAAGAGQLAFGPLSSFLLFRLLNERPVVVDPANASRTQLWNPATGAWEPELLSMFGLASEHLPRPVHSRHAFGTLGFAAVQVPVTACTGDQCAVPYAFGNPPLQTAYVNMGTGAFIQRLLSHPIVAPPLLSSILWSETNTAQWSLEGTVNGGGSALDWFALQENVDLDPLLQSVETATLTAARDTHDLPLFLNGVSGLGSPFWRPDFQSRFVGGSRDTFSKFLAVLESILFLIRANLDEMRRYPPALTHITLTGGLAASGFLCQSLADLTALTVARPAEREATARGLAFLLADRPKHWSAQDVQLFQPQPNPALARRFEAWLQAMQAQL